MERWEYHTEVWTADAKDNDARSYLQRRWPDWEPPKYAVRSLIPKLNSFGKDGWELISLLPVEEGKNGDVALCNSNSNGKNWAHQYLVVLRRHLPE